MRAHHLRRHLRVAVDFLLSFESLRLLLPRGDHPPAHGSGIFRRRWRTAAPCTSPLAPRYEYRCDRAAALKSSKHIFESSAACSGTPFSDRQNSHRGKDSSPRRGMNREGNVTEIAALAIVTQSLLPTAGASLPAHCAEILEAHPEIKRHCVRARLRPGPRNRATANQTRITNRVMRRPERSRAHQSPDNSPEFQPRCEFAWSQSPLPATSAARL